MEAAHRDDAPGHRSRAEARVPLASPRQIHGEVRQVGGGDGIGVDDAVRDTPVGVAREITTVRRHGVARQAPLHDEVVEVVPDRTLERCDAQARTSSSATGAMSKASATAAQVTRPSWTLSPGLRAASRWSAPRQPKSAISTA